MKAGIVLIVVGGLLLLGAIAAGAIGHDRDQERVAEFYRKNSNAAVLPHQLQPPPFTATEAFGFLAGGVMVLAGIWRSRTPAARSPAPNGAS